MKHSITSIKSRAAALMAAVAASTMSAMAQSDVDGKQVFNTMGSTLKETVQTGLTVVMIVIILAGAAGLIVAYIKYVKEDRSSQDAMVKIGIGTAVAFAFCSIFKLILKAL